MNSLTHAPIEQVALPQDPPQPDRGSILEVVEKIGSVTVPIAVALYAMLYLGLQHVYAIFGITPEQAGLDQATIFARLIGTLVTIFLYLLPVVGVVVTLFWLADLLTRGGAGRAVTWIREKPWIAATFAAMLSATGYWAYLTTSGGFSEDLHIDYGSAVLPAAVIALVGLLIPYRIMRRRGATRAGMKVITGALVGVGLGFLLVIQMLLGAVDIYVNGNGNPVLDLVGFKNQWVTVHDGDGKAVVEDDDRVLMLGEKEGAYVYYNCGDQRTYRRPIEATILGDFEIDPDFTNGGTEEPMACGYGLAEQQ
ncbi:hypothetical protein [Nonomuraea pusilla]|uniref:Uncharacterized protein n=1 Tax=Nonomuraea pusilla TaxID=46177 RepID=A0A1H7GGC8_9ACTN|nr:hypothetical protein [Nonomuraea pusilla]SEK35972.1 hypothetical protein SAMN05660976_00353 [Nonomuraea pusilla]